MGQIIRPWKPVAPMELAGRDPVVLQTRQGMDIFALRVHNISERPTVAQPLQFLIGLEIRVIFQKSEDHPRFFLDFAEHRAVRQGDIAGRLAQHVFPGAHSSDRKGNVLRKIVAQQHGVHVVLDKLVKIRIESDIAVFEAVILTEAQVGLLIVADCHDLRARFFRHADQTAPASHAIADISDAEYAKADFSVLHFRDLYQPLFLLYVFFSHHLPILHKPVVVPEYVYYIIYQHFQFDKSNTEKSSVWRTLPHNLLMSGIPVRGFDGQSEDPVSPPRHHVPLLHHIETA